MCIRDSRVAGDDHPFNELVGVLVDDVAVLEGAGDVYKRQGEG